MIEEKEKTLPIDDNQKNEIADGLSTAFKNYVLMVKAPFRAIKAGSFQPVRDAFEENLKNSKERLNRHP